MRKTKDGKTITFISCDSEINLISGQLPVKQAIPWAQTNHSNTKLICGLDIGNTGISIHLKSIKVLMQFCEGCEIPMFNLLDQIEKARYELIAN